MTCHSKNLLNASTLLPHQWAAAYKSYLFSFPLASSVLKLNVPDSRQLYEVIHMTLRWHTIRQVLRFAVE